MIALALATAIAISHIVTIVIIEPYDLDLDIAMGSYPRSLFNSWIGAGGIMLEPTLYFFLLPLLVCIPFSDSFFTDKKSGYSRNILTRVSNKKYYLAKSISVFLVGSSVAILPLLLNLFISAMYFPAIIPILTAGTFTITDGSMWVDIFYSQPFLYVFLYFLIIFFFSGLIALSSLLFSYVLSNRFLVTIAPFATLAFIEFVLSSLSWAPWGGSFCQLSPISFMFPAQYDMASFPIILGEFIVFALTFTSFLFIRARRDEVL